MHSIAVVSGSPSEFTLLTTIERVKQELEIIENDSDALLTAKIKEATSDIELRCRTFRRETLTATFWPEAARGRVRAEGLILPRWPIASVTSITVDDALVAGGEYRIDPDAGMIYRLDSSGYPSHWEFCKSSIVVYAGGYKMPGEEGSNLPPSLEAACIELVSSFWSARGRDPTVKSEENPGVARFEYWVGAIGAVGDLPPGVMSKITPFLRSVII